MIFGRCKLHTTRSAGPPKWYNSPGLSPGCWVATCLVRSRWHSDATGRPTRWLFQAVWICCGSACSDRAVV